MASEEKLEMAYAHLTSDALLIHTRYSVLSRLL